MKAVVTIIAALAAFASAWARDIHSTLEGGLWTSSTTWQSGTVPGQADNVFLHGPVAVNDTLNCHNITVYSNAMLYPSVNHNTLNVGGSLVNTGTVDNFPGWYFLTLNCAGNVTSNSQFTPQQLIMSGSGNQYISTSGNFKPSYFTKTSDFGTVTPLTDLNLVGCQINFNGGTLNLSGGRQLSLNGGSITGISILGTGGGSLNLTGNVNLWDTTADEIILQGGCNIGNGVSIDILHNYAVLQSCSNMGYSIQVTGRLNNYGTLQNFPGYSYLTLDLAGDLYNYGTLSNNTINLSGDGVQVLWQDNGSPEITCLNFTAQATTAPIQLMSNLRFNGCTVNLGGRTLRLFTPTASHTLSVTGAQLKNAVIQGNSASTLNLAGGCRLSNLAVDEARFTGDACCSSGVVVGIMHNYGVLQSFSNMHYSIQVTGRLNNYGTLQNFPGYSYLTLDLAGDLYNYGSLNNHRTYINGNADQYLNMYPGCSVSCEGGFVLVSEIGAGQWYFNGAAQLPDNTEQYNANPFVQGVWQLYNGSAWSRHIYIDEGLNAPLNLILTVSPANALTLQWDQVPNATAYKVYYATAPGGPWSAFTGLVIDDDTGDGIVTYPVGQSQHHMFYRVTSLK
jgi:hypothetical protein